MLLREITLSAGPGLRIDEEAGVIFDVKIIGNRSANGRVYPQKTLDRAKSMYENRPVNLNHRKTEKDGSRTGERRVEDRIGKFANVRATEGLIGDFHYIKAHPYAGQLVETAKRMPEQFGMSHTADGKVEKVGNEATVTEIVAVESIDLVSDPATTKSLFEEIERDGKAREIIERLSDDAEKMVAALREMMAGPVANGAMPVADGMQSVDNQVNAAFEAAIVAAWRDMTADKATTLKKFRTILDAREKLMGTKEPEPGTGTAGAPAATATKEGAEPAAKAADVAALQEKIAKLEADKALNEAKDDARKLLGIAKIDATDDLVETLAKLPTTDDRKKLIESFPKPGATGQQPPRSGQASGGKAIDESKKAPCDVADDQATAAYLMAR